MGEGIAGGHDRRSFLRFALGTGLAVAGGSVLTACESISADYGGLLPADSNGLMLPPGFTSRIVATTGSTVPGTTHTWHTAPDGGACFPTNDGGWIYVSNSEAIAGGAGMVRFDATGAVVDARSILTGTLGNCAGGPTPWGTWLSCEEWPFGRVWECDPYGVNPTVERPAMGKFQHEAAAVDPVNHHVYLTEDRTDGGLYRFVPTSYPDLSSGTLEILTDVGGALSWATVPDPDGQPVETRYQVPNTKIFNGGEGIWYRPSFITFSTKGDNKIWIYVPGVNGLGVLYDDNTSPTPVLSGVDNVTTPSTPGPSHVFVCEDGGNMEVVAVDIETGGQSAFVFCRITGRLGSEVTGAAFSPDGNRLYFSSQRSPGETFEVTGPFRTHATTTTTTA